jgi:hypothetical protein
MYLVFVLIYLVLPLNVFSSPYVSFQIFPPLCTHLIFQVLCFGSTLAYCQFLFMHTWFRLVCLESSMVCSWFSYVHIWFPKLCVGSFLVGVFNPICAHSISFYVYWVLFGVFLNPFCAHSVSFYVFRVLLSFFLHPFCAHLVPPCGF